jgi:hypothetical protein
MMTDDERPIQPNEERPADPPDAVQWMMQQAAAGQSHQTAPLPPSALGFAPAGGSTTETLAAREQRVRDALLGNARLTENLPDEAARSLMDLGLDIARLVVRDTAGLDDAAAEDIIQPRVRAVRRLMMSTAQATQPGDASAIPLEWPEQAAIALGDRFRRPDELEAAAFDGAWRALHGRPVDQVAALRRFIEEHTGRQA